MTKPLVFLLLACLPNCGGSSEHVPTSHARSGGEAGSPSEAAAGSPATDPAPPAEDGGAGGSPSVDLSRNQDEESGGAGGEAMVAVPPPMRSATGYCLDDRDCFELACVGLSSANKLVCLASCAQNEDCAINEECIVDARIGSGSGCFPRCDWPTDCAFGFDCFSRQNNGQYLCVPAEWTLRGF